MVFDFVPQSTLPGTVTTKGVTGPKVRPEVQEAEIQLAVCAAVHFSIVVIDHVGELMTTHGRDRQRHMSAAAAATSIDEVEEDEDIDDRDSVFAFA